ncbi:MAG: hypothetical protein AVDCRST_MAG93-4846 [uncultured Chloroflexia bacterium]|uniref:Uncharacterized protein n=1 Tax=uncultured Chloroflexia bacterium TaxID=1672391 RepID=A0A6J4KFU2_9CHLR|nr:MAG: hypothetical protein AVDCRST_MAG93-4846 [uncultured Chloroflexia bacterium]
MKWGSSEKNAVYRFNCLYCRSPRNELYPLGFTSTSTPASCPSCMRQMHHVTDSLKTSTPATRIETEQLHLRLT